MHKFSEHVRWFVHRLYIERIFGCRDRNVFVHFKAAYLRRILPFRQYKDILEAVAASGLVEWDRRYIIDKEARSYRICKDLRAKTHRRHAIKSYILNKKLDDLRNYLSSSLREDVHRHLLRYRHELEIDYPAMNAAENDEQQLSVAAIQDKNWYFTADEYGRVHTNLTNLASPLRYFLRWNGQPLVNLDVRNSQPLLF